MNAAWIVFLKEIIDNARDRRTLFSALFFGPLFGPLLFAVLVNMMVSRTVSSVEVAIDVPVVAAEEAPNLVAFLAARGIRAQDTEGLVDLEAAVAAVERGEHEALLWFEPGFGAHFAAGKPARVALLHDQSNTRASGRVQRVRSAISVYAQQIGTLKLVARGVDPDVVSSLILDEIDVSTPAGRSVMLLGMLTYFLLLASLMGGFYLAIDSTAGERERRSLEPLLTTPVDRSSLVLGKMAAAGAYMVLGLALTLIGFTVALRFLPLEQIGMSSNFGVAAALGAFAVLLPFIPLGAALMTFVASFTKSYKEAQTWLTLVLLVPTLPLLFATLLNVKPSAALMWIPSLSQHLVITALIRGDPISALYVLESAVASLAIAALLGYAAVRLYRRETLLG